ncbi:chemotaxis protein CheW [Magnetococcales bacterium HHB-1]
MDDFIETLWSQFAIETEEHTEGIESILIALEDHAGDSETISALFRAFHSIKGLSRAMEMTGMESVAHRSEDLLGLIRSGDLELTPQISALLLDALDALKDLRDDAVEERKNGAPPETLLKRLEQALSGEVSPEVEASPEEVAKEDDSQTSSEAQIEASAKIFNADPEMLTFFAELCTTELPLLAQLLTPSDEPSSAALDALYALENAAEVMEFQHLHEAFQQLKTNMSVPPYPVEDNIKTLFNVREIITDLEKEIHNSCGASTLTKALAEQLFDQLDPLFQTLSNQLDQWPPQETESRTKEALNIAASAEALYHYLSLYPDTPAYPLILLLADIFHRPTENLLEPSIAFSNQLSQIINWSRLSYQAQAEGESSPFTEEEVEELALDIRQRLTTPTATQEQDEVLKAFELSEELEEILTPENVQDLKGAMAQGQHLYTIIADLDSAPEASDAFFTWATEEAMAITSRSLFHQGQSLFEFLITSFETQDDILKKLNQIDASGALFSVQSLTSPSSASPPADPPPKKRAPEKEKGTSKKEPLPARKSGHSYNIIRVTGETLDTFMNRIGEMVLVRSQLSHVIHDEKVRQSLIALKKLSEDLRQDGNTEAIADQIMQHQELLMEQRQTLIQSEHQIQGALLQLQENVMALRVVPIETVFKRFPRVVRDLARKTGKEVKLVLSGQEVRIDKSMVDALVDPLMHMVRNSLDHGLEPPEEREQADKTTPAKLELSAVQRGNRVFITVQDDGRGLDAEKIRQKAVERGIFTPEESLSLPPEAIFQTIFHPGFSTAEKVTETSGRGVGMDVVQTLVSRLGGEVDVRSELGQGTNVTLKLPLSAAIQNVLLVESARHTLAIPDRFVSEILEIPRRKTQSIKGRQAIPLRQHFLPIHPLSHLLSNTPEKEPYTENLHVVVLTNGKNRIGITVTRLYNREELFVKDIHPQLAALPGIGGASILGNGRVVLILDVEELFLLAERKNRNAFGKPPTSSERSAA